MNRRHSCNQGRDCPARKIPPYPHTPGEALPECPCSRRQGDGPSNIDAVAGVALAVIVMVFLSVAAMTLWRAFH